MTHPIRARLLGLAATVAILTVLIGIPATLVAIGANPIPNRVPTLDQLTTALTTRDDGTLTLRVLTVAAWLAWAFLAATITLELVARLRGVSAPRLPGLALPQSAAHGLVGAAVLLFVAAPTLALPSMLAAPAAAAAPAWAIPATQTAQLTASAQLATTPSQVTTTPPANRMDPTGAHTVTRGESLWSIAATELGDGHRWRELADLNPGTHGPDWVIHPGTVLTLPASATAATQPPKNGQSYTVEAGDTLSQIAHHHLGDANRYPDIVEASRHVRQPDGRHLRDPDLIYPGWHLTIPDTTATTQGTSTAERTPTETPPNGAPAAAVPGTPVSGSKPADPGPSSSAAPSSGAASGNGSVTPTRSTSAATSPAPTPAVDPSHAATTTSPDDSAQTPAPWLLAGLAGGPVLAGSMWILLRQRRAMQVRHRRPGRTVATPPPVLAPVEKTLATAGSAMTPAVEFVDAVLRHRGPTSGTRPAGRFRPAPTPQSSGTSSPTRSPPTRCSSPSAPATPATCGCSTARTSRSP